MGDVPLSGLPRTERLYPAHSYREASIAAATARRTWKTASGSGRILLE